jgi:hypothetical protein
MERPLTEKDLEPREGQQQGMAVSNPAWKRYMRAVDVWEEPLEKAENLNECICGRHV